MGLGQKFDNDKDRWDLLPFREVTCVVRILTGGAKKYADNNWQHVPTSGARYFAAAMRHITAWRSGEVIDPDFGEPHLAHAVCCLLFLMWFDFEEKADDQL